MRYFTASRPSAYFVATPHNADDVARADRRGKRDAQRFKARDVAFAVILCAQDQRECTRQMHDLDEREPDGQQDARPDEQRDERHAPEERVDRVQHGEK